jgi:two-component system chemotaxis response regulator CheY
MPTILVVDDSTTIRRILSYVCTNMGYEVLEAVDGITCTQMILDHPNEISLIILDWHMPGKPSLDLLKWIKKYSPTARVLMLTSDANTIFTPQQAQAAGATKCLYKPFDGDLLKFAIEECLNADEAKSA